MIPIEKMTPVELAGFVGEHLGRHGVNVVLSGGACVAYYSEGKYVSLDLDFVNVASERFKKIQTAMFEIGFEERNRYFSHTDTDYLIEFPPGPLAVGDEQITEVVEVKTDMGAFRIISPTDCVKDRLAAYYHWGDLPCLEQAVMVAVENKVDLDELKRWSEVENSIEKFQVFLEKKASEAT